MKSISNLTAISWSNLSFYTTPFAQSSSPKVLLRQLNGSFATGTLNALLGPSGSGKSTFLSILSGHVPFTGQLTTESVVTRPNEGVIFLEQYVHETVHHQLTVKQLLQYAFYFKNKNKEIDDWQVEYRIKEVMGMLMLDDTLLKRRFGNASGGEQKRVAIGQELMAGGQSLGQKMVMLIDEPTTGLDSSSALEVMRSLKRLTQVEG